MKSVTSPQSNSIEPDLAADPPHVVMTSEDIASAERALKQLALITEDPKAADSLLQFAADVRPVSHWGLNE